MTGVSSTFFSILVCLLSTCVLMLMVFPPPPPPPLPSLFILVSTFSHADIKTSPSENGQLSDAEITFIDSTHTRSKYEESPLLKFRPSDKEQPSTHSKVLDECGSKSESVLLKNNCCRLGKFLLKYFSENFYVVSFVRTKVLVCQCGEACEVF